MKTRASRSFSMAVALAVCVVAAPAARAQIPETFTNLQVLPMDISRGELVLTMRGFASALGVRCVHCHAGKDTPNLEGVDFASDEKEPKRAARLMMKMVRAIDQDHLSKLPQAVRTRVQCVTCHRGLARPRTIQDEVKEALDGGGAEAAVARYRELRTGHYGDGGYDFGQGPLNAVGEELIRAGKAGEAAALLELNAGFHPDAAWTHYLLGEAFRGLGEVDKARTAYERSASLEPRNPMARKRLEEMAQPSPKP
jgi:tetratricopeptide (TPR) repeat protein